MIIATSSIARASDRAEKLEVIKKFYAVFETGDFKVLPDVITTDYTQYPADPGQNPGIDGFIMHAKMFGGMFSEMKMKHTHILVDGDLVQVRGEYEVTHSGDAFGIKKTGKRITFVAFDLHQFNKEGKIEKTWHLEDYWGLYSQLTEK